MLSLFTPTVMKAKSKTSYYHCEHLLGGVDVVAIYSNCDEGQEFNPKSKSCEAVTVRAARSAVAPKNCPEGQKWNIDTQSCQTFHLAPECEGKNVQERFADPKSKSSYYYCAQLLGGVDVVPLHADCPKGQEFNPKSKSCEAVTVRAARSAVAPQDCPEGQKWNIDTQSCQTVHNAPECEGKNVHENFADSKSKTSYYHCEHLLGGVDVVAIHSNCDEGQEFN